MVISEVKKWEIYFTDPYYQFKNLHKKNSQHEEIDNILRYKVNL